METITKFIFGLPMLALACGSIAFAEVPPVTPPDSAAKAAALGAPGGDPVNQMVAFASGSRWHLTVNAMDEFGLVITGASFQKTPTSPFIYVLFDGRLGEIFVPYHNGGLAYLDISKPAEHTSCLTLNAEKFPPPRHFIDAKKDADGKIKGKICKEVRDYLAWMTRTEVRYGQEVVYFSVYNTGNYDYVMEWTFRDDGTIVARAGSTGPKTPIDPKLGHMHDFTWRLDIDLNGAGGNSAYLTSHNEDLDAETPLSSAKDERDRISVEGSRVWNPLHFNTLEILPRI